MKKYTPFLIAIFLAFVSGCEYQPIVPNDVPDVGDVSFSQDVEPIFTTVGCVNCHKGSRFPDLSTGYAYGSLMSKPETTDYGYDMNIYNFPHPSTGSHSNRYKTDQQAAMVKAWIDQGKKDN
jgi:hypothetical protein